MNPSNPRLLLVEDDPAIARTTAYALQREGFEVHHVLLAAEAEAALAAVGAGYAAALLDIGLPDGSGLELCRRVRAAGGLPIIMLSARTEEIDKVLALELGADDYMSKPFSPRELCARVRSLLRRSQLAPAMSHEPSRPWLHCDAQTGQAWCAGQAVQLTRLEFKLLATMLQRPGRIWPRELLLDAAWGPQVRSADRTVDTHIKTLRAKLREAAPGHEPIVTHRGQGYALQLPGQAA